MFNKIVLKYYEKNTAITLLEGELELDETHLYKEKRTHARHRPYAHRSVWLFGIKNRVTKEFVIIPITSRDEETLISLILKHAKVGSVLYSDSYTAYVNNRTFPKISKLMQYGYIHFYVNHDLEFTSSLFPQVHTNNIENMWKELKQNIKRMKMTSQYRYGIARFYLHKTLSKKEQLMLLADALKEEI